MVEESNNYISLQEATKCCPYSQEYLSLRARQGKLKAVKFGRNWVTKKEWLEEYLKEVEEYNNKIKIQKFVAPPPNLPVEKIPVLRFGFVTALVFVLLATSCVFGKESFKSVFETLNPYVIRISQASDFVAKEIFEETKDFYSQIGSAIFTIMKKTESIKIGRDFREGLNIVTANVAEDVDNFLTSSNRNLTKIKNDTSILLREFNENFNRRLVEISQKLSKYISSYTYIIRTGQLADIEKATEASLREYFSWLGSKIFGLGEKIVQGYTTANDFVEEKIGQNIQQIKEGAKSFAEKTKAISQSLKAKAKKEGKKTVKDLKEIARQTKGGYLTANDFVEKKLTQGYKAITRPFSQVYQFITQPRGAPLTKEELMEIEERETKKIIEEIQKLKEEGVPVKEVERIIKIEPIKEITKEVIKIDDKELQKLKSQIAEIQKWEKDIKTLQELTTKLQPHPAYISVPTAPVYIGSQGLQVGGVGIFASLGVTGSLGVGSLGVGGSAVFGADSGDELTVNSTANFLSPASFQRITAGGLTIDSVGNLSTSGTFTAATTTLTSLTTTGNLVVGGNLTVSGAQTYSGVASFIVTSTSPALTVQQNGAGEIALFQDGERAVFTIGNNGNLTLAASPSATTPAFLIQPSDTSNWSTGTQTYLGINATSNFSGYLVDFQKSGVSLFSINQDGSMILAGTATAATFVSGSTDSTVRKSGEEVLRGSVSIFRYSMPAETSTTTFFQISKYFSDNHPLTSLPATLPGTTRVYRLVINYTDDLATTATSSWQIYRPVAATTTDTFSLPGQNCTSTNLSCPSLESAKPYITELVTIPDDDWQVEVKLPDNTKTIRIFNIFLVAYDQIL